MRQSPSSQKESSPPKTAKIIAIYSQKGGAGKTQTTMQLSASLALRGYDVLVIDMDPQATATMWSSQANEGRPFPATVISLAAQGRNMTGELRKLESMYDFILVDCRPALDDAATWSVLHLADIGIIPAIPLLDNLWSSAESRDKGLSVRDEKNEKLKLFYLAANVGRGNVYQYGIDVLRKDENIKCFNATISTRSSFAESQYIGASVHALGSRAKAAIDEIEALTDELLSHIEP